MLFFSPRWFRHWLLNLSLILGAAAVFADDPDPTLRLLFVGDVMLDNGPGHLISHGTDPFAPCASLLASADLTIANLECVVGQEGDPLYKPYIFRAAPESPPFLRKHFDAVSLANNHSFDFGIDGFLDSLRLLKAHSIPYFGGGYQLREAREPWVVTCKGRKIGLLGYNEFRAENYAATENSAGNAPLIEADVLADIRRARESLGCEIVVPFLHWGEELEATPRPDQTQLARKMIEAGATAVMGTHPHVTQTIEYHRGAPIVYSLGNFVFDYYPGDPRVWTGWVVTLKIAPDGQVELDKTVVELDLLGVPHIVGQQP
jgi:poly-gamma-glutamate capsule biosynthesis protein CapA/YwtB (metallophosphatase superfamily)